tara:strand:- start:3355 stop:3459 length:105 start_codon:yes stop_codon:yes gene_type:complete
LIRIDQALPADVLATIRAHEGISQTESLRFNGET